MDLKKWIFVLSPLVFLALVLARACVETSKQEMSQAEPGNSLPNRDTVMRVFESKKSTESVSNSARDDAAHAGVSSSDEAQSKGEAQSEGEAAETRPLEDFEPILSGEYVESDTRMYVQKVYELSSKYPLIMKQEIYETSPLDSSRKVFLGERQFVADHILVKFKEGWSEDMVISAMAKVGFVVRKKMSSEQLYLISFPLLEHDSWNKAAETLRSLDAVSAVVPDIYSKALF